MGYTVVPLTSLYVAAEASPNAAVPRDCNETVGGLTPIPRRLLVSSQKRFALSCARLVPPDPAKMTEPSVKLEALVPPFATGNTPSTWIARSTLSHEGSTPTPP